MREIGFATQKFSANKKEESQSAPAESTEANSPQAQPSSDVFDESVEFDR